MNTKVERELLSKPGDTIFETIMAQGLTRTEVAVEMDITTEDLQNIMDGEKPLDVEIANKLHAALGVDAKFWLNREANYRKKLAEIEKVEARMEIALTLLGGNFYQFRNNINSIRFMFPEMFKEIHPLLNKVEQALQKEGEASLSEMGIEVFKMWNEAAKQLSSDIENLMEEGD